MSAVSFTFTTVPVPDPVPLSPRTQKARIEEICRLQNECAKILKDPQSYLQPVEFRPKPREISSEYIAGVENVTRETLHPDKKERVELLGQKIQDFLLNNGDENLLASNITQVESKQKTLKKQWREFKRLSTNPKIDRI